MNRKKQTKKVRQSQYYARRFLAFISDTMDKIMVGSVLFLGLVLFVIVYIVLQSSLKEEQQSFFIAVFSPIVTVAIVPVQLENYKRRNAFRAKITTENLPLYTELCKILLTILEEEKDRTENHLAQINDYICRNVTQINMFFSLGMLNDLSFIKFDLTEGSLKSAKTYSKHLIKKIRHQLAGNTLEKLYVSGSIIVQPNREKNQAAIGEGQKGKQKKVKK